MQTATGQTIQSVKDTFGKVVVCNAADPRSQQNICRENAYAVSPYAHVYGLQMEGENGKVQKAWQKVKPEKGFIKKSGYSMNQKR